MTVTAASRARHPSLLGKVQDIRRRTVASSTTSNNLPTMAVPTQSGASTEASARAARQARRDQMRENSRITQTGSTAKAGVTSRFQAARTAQALAGQPQQPPAQQDANVHLLGASKERAAGSPEPRVTRSSARAAQAQHRHHPYQRPKGAAAPTAAANGQGVQTRSAVRRQQQDAQDARPDPGKDSGLLISRQLRSAQASQTETPAPAAVPDAAHSRMRLRARKPAGCQAGVHTIKGPARRTCEENGAGSTPALAAQQTNVALNRSQRSKRPRDRTAEAAIPDAGEQAAPSSDGGVNAQALSSAERNGAHPAHPAKRLRRAPPTVCAGPAVLAPTAATSRSVRQAQKRRSNAKRRRHVQRRRPAAQQKPVAAQQAPHVAEQAPIGAQHLPNVVLQGPGSPQQTSSTTPQGPGAAQQGPAPAQPAAQQDEVQRARTDPSERSGPVTRSKRLLSGGEQQRSAQAPQTEAPAPAPSSSAAQLSMQLRARKPAGRQADADGTSSAARHARAGRSAGSSPPPVNVAGQGNHGRNLRGKRPVHPDPSRPVPPMPAQQAESGPSGSQRGKRLRNAAEVAIPEAGQPAALTHDDGETSQPLESAERSGRPPDLAPEAVRSAKRSRLATPNDSAGVEAAAPAAARASATSRSVRGAQQHRNASKRRQRVQAQAPVAQEEPAVTQQAPVAAAQQPAPAAPQEPIPAQQAPAAAQEELHAPQASHVRLQGPGAAQQEPAPAQPAAQQVQVQAAVTPVAAVPSAIYLARLVNPGASWRPQPQSRLHKQIVRQFPLAMMGKRDCFDRMYLLDASPEWAQRIVHERTMTRGFIDSGGKNINLFPRRWKKPPCSKLSVATGPTVAAGGLPGGYHVN